jgi:hypothetical protein
MDDTLESFGWVMESWEINVFFLLTPFLFSATTLARERLMGHFSLFTVFNLCVFIFFSLVISFEPLLGQGTR